MQNTNEKEDSNKLGKSSSMNNYCKISPLKYSFTSSKKDIHKAKEDFHKSLNKCYSNISQLRNKIKTISNTPSVAESGKKKEFECKNDLISEENEKMHITNTILNRTNVDLLNTLKELKVYKDKDVEMKEKTNNLLEYNDYLKKKIIQYEKENKELFSFSQAFNVKISNLQNENENLNKQLREITLILQTKEKYCDELKENFNATKGEMDKDNFMLVNELKNKQAVIDELSNKLKLTEEMNQNLQKNINDYEIMISNMKNTIKILGEEDKKVPNYPEIIKEKDIALKEKDNIIIQLNKKIQKNEVDIVEHNLQINKLNFDINEMNQMKSEISNKDKQIDNLNNKIKTLYQIISDKENIISQLNQNFDLINQTLVEIKNKNDELSNNFDQTNVTNTNNQTRYSPMENLSNIKHYLNEIDKLINNASSRRQIQSNRSDISSVNINAQRNYSSSLYAYDDMLAKVTELQKENAILQARLSQVSSNEDKVKELTDENEKLITENILLKNECESANKKFNQILKETSTNYVIPQNSGNSIGSKNQRELPGFFSSRKKILVHSDDTNSEVFLFRIYDNKRILRFDLAIHEYQIIEFIDEDDFDSNFISEGSCYLNTLDGLYILCGKNFDTLYYYSNETSKIFKVAQFSHSHSHGGMLLDIENGAIFVLSGWENKKVEKYVNPSIICNETYNNNTSKKWEPKFETLKDMTIERSESSYLYINDIIYSFFGYCYPTSKYIDTIEYINTQDPSSEWKLLNYKTTMKAFLIKSAGIVPINENELFILGGFDGLKETSVENLILFNLKTQTLERINKKLPDIVYNHCYDFGKESQFISFLDDEGKIYMSNIDEMDNVHIIELPTLRYDLFKFD